MAFVTAVPAVEHYVLVFPGKMSLTVRQVSQVSAAFKQQLDQFQQELDNNDAVADRLKDMFKTSSPQLDALAQALRERTNDLAQIEAMSELSNKQVKKLSAEGRFIDDQTIQASRLCESLTSSSSGYNSFAKVTIVPSHLTELNTRQLEHRTEELERSANTASEVIEKLSSATSTSAWSSAVDDLSSRVVKKSTPVATTYPTLAYF